MFAKIFSQIFDSTIAGNYLTRHVFMDLLVLADSDGCVDMTADAIARRTNVPVDIVNQAIMELCTPDLNSRTDGDDGRRLIPIDSRRSWGWHVVNYGKYRAIRDEEARREYHRNYRRAKRAEEKKPKRHVSTKHNTQLRESGPSATTDEINAALRVCEEPVINGNGVCLAGILTNDAQQS